VKRAVKSQWDFGELFPPDQFRQVLTVSELTAKVRTTLQQEIGEVWVTGEITNLRFQPSGHGYFVLKDAAAQLSCVLFRGETQADRSLLQDGRSVILRGELTVFESRGLYQLRVTLVEVRGLGALQAAFEKLKQKLSAAGWFSADRKRPLPRYPRRIGLVTSPAGAAIRDVLHVIERRHPALEIFLAPCRVQGEGAAAEIAAAIRLLSEFDRLEAEREATGAADTGRRLDLILVTRGGGSLEDLWAFNEELVARAVFESGVPVVSAVGHEVDYTICDFVADLRAATPSAGAEIITEGVVSCRQFLVQAPDRLRHLAAQRLDGKRLQLRQIAQRLARNHPRSRTEEAFQRLDILQAALLRCAKQGARRERTALATLTARLARLRPSVILGRQNEKLQTLKRRLREQGRLRLLGHCDKLKGLGTRLRLLGPEHVLGRGYSITMDAKTGSVIRNAARIKPGQRLKTRLKAGEVISRVEH
jgi:exodeoxyribonuclease VII large subunit